MLREQRMAAFPRPQAWSVYLRRALLTLPADDAELLHRESTPLMAAREAALPSYPWASQTTQ
ncbi:hypothetical protein GCM10027290_38660 [Micromonospora sonneratiae]|uniref:Uncharacterized protein n=1 Tax=Micromonospora sonneratiae TaxID=1184706 RepID=A0ABW3YBJ8_9ACTN